MNDNDNVTLTIVFIDGSRETHATTLANFNMALSAGRGLLLEDETLFVPFTAVKTIDIVDRD